MNSMHDFTDHLSGPLINGFTFCDGSIHRIDIQSNWPVSTGYTFKPINVSSITELESDGEMHWNNYAIISTTVDQLLGLEVLCGQGNHGSDGFLAVIDLNTNRLVWIASFDCSNPFDSAIFRDGNIIGQSTNGCVWTFKIAPPSLINIRC